MTNISIIILVIAGGVIIAVYLVYRLLRKFLGTPILEVSLSPIEDAKWSNRKKAADLTEWFMKNGFEFVGLYECIEMPTLIISGFVHPSERTMGIIYDHPMAGIWVDICEQYDNGRSLTVSNAPAGQAMDHMPQTTKIYSRESTVEELYKIFMAERRKTGQIPISKEDFASTFETEYNKEMKWRADRGGPTSFDVMKIGAEIGVSLDSESLMEKTGQVHETWAREKNKLGKKKRSYVPGLPDKFRSPEVFRRRLEEMSGPAPKLNIPPLPVYIILIGLICYWCYYGYQYTRNNTPISITDIIVFFSVFLIFFIPLMWFREYHRQVSAYPVLRRMADLRPGAFLFTAGNSATIFYTRETWIGMVSFKEGSEHNEAFTRLEATTRHALETLIISRRNILDKVLGWSDKEKIQLPDSEFSRKFTVSGTDAGFAGRLLGSTISSLIIRLEEFKKPLVEIDRNSVAVEVSEDFSVPRKETLLNQFLETAENIIDAVAE